MPDLPDAANRRSGGDSRRLDVGSRQSTPEARNGQIVVARIDDEVTVKRFKRRGHHVQLLPENTDFEPIDVDLRHQSLDIEGLGVGVVRINL